MPRPAHWPAGRASSSWTRSSTNYMYMKLMQVSDMLYNCTGNTSVLLVDIWRRAVHRRFHFSPLPCPHFAGTAAISTEHNGDRDCRVGGGP